MLNGSYAVPPPHHAMRNLMESPINPYQPIAIDQAPRWRWEQSLSFRFLVVVAFLISGSLAIGALWQQNWLLSCLWISVVFACIPLADRDSSISGRLAMSLALPVGVFFAAVAVGIMLILMRYDFIAEFHRRARPFDYLVAAILGFIGGVSVGWTINNSLRKAILRAWGYETLGQDGQQEDLTHTDY